MTVRTAPKPTLPVPARRNVDRRAKAVTGVRARLTPLKPRDEPPQLDYVRHKVAIVDCPWSFKARSDKGKKKNPKYDVMSFDELRALRPTVSALMERSAVLLMWSTAPHLASALALIAEWGFEYKSYMIWKKDKAATGYWARSNCEIVLVATRGQPGAPKPGTQALSVFEGKPIEKKHSSKPDWLHKWVEKHYGDATKLELFARRKREGWTTVGGDLGTFITPTGITSKFLSVAIEVAEANIKTLCGMKRSK